MCKYIHIHTDIFCVYIINIHLKLLSDLAANCGASAFHDEMNKKKRSETHFKSTKKYH